MGGPYEHLEMEVVATDLAFPEGPVASKDGGVLVVEVRGGRLTRVTPAGVVEPIANTGGGPNAAATGPDGAVYVCQNGGASWGERPWPYDDPEAIRLELPVGKSEDPRQPGIQRVTFDGGVETLYVEVDGEPLKKPNDLVFDAEGGFYFTDTGGVSGRKRDVTGVLYALPDGSSIREVLFPVEMGNGIGLSPDCRTLYVAETRTRRIWACGLDGPGRIRSRRSLATVPGGGPLGVGGCDSLCVDSDGNVIVGTLGAGGITVVSPRGEILAHVPCPDPMTTNACFGGPDLRTLYVTLSSTGKLVRFDDWPVQGLPLQWAL